MATQVRDVRQEVCQLILRTAPVVVSSCVGAHQLLAENATFPMVVLDEGSQATEPALLCALAAAKAEQLIILGDLPLIAADCRLISAHHPRGHAPVAADRRFRVG